MVGAARAFGNDIALPTKYADLLDEVYMAASVTADLRSDPATVAAGASVKEFKYMQCSTDGLGDYGKGSGRNGGYTDAAVKIEWKTATANYDRGAKMEIDDVDNQETFNKAMALAGSTIQRTKVAPEADAFTFATICGKAGISKVDTPASLADGAAVLAALSAALDKMDEDEVLENRHLYITSALLRAVRDLDTTKSREVLGEFTKIVKVPQKRFYTAIDLLDGFSTGEEAGHYAKATAGKEINFMIIEPSAVIKHDKHVADHVIPPSANPDSDAYITKYRKYGIVDVYDHKTAGIYLHHKA
ncbi:MAG: hypothetical protein FDZ75_05525 [Actinobacteria bacterium]|nr:MAG: hypothetical protein FDZ75_05525 [Actinomycetota bacterium]